MEVAVSGVKVFGKVSDGETICADLVVVGVAGS
jgi:hypothetical protein